MNVVPELRNIRMMNIVQNYSKLEDKNIPQIIGKTILWEKEIGTFGATECRNQIKDKIKGERRKLGIGFENR